MGVINKYTPGSEKIFAKFLDDIGIKYQRDFPVSVRRGTADPPNVDFCLDPEGLNVYCDVKEVKNSEIDQYGKVQAHFHIREDIRSLRKKFRSRPEVPVILVTMNFSDKFFTGWSVRVAMLGDIGFEFSRSNGKVSAPYHLANGHAALTRKHNTVISGILVYDLSVDHNHHFFANPFAREPLPTGFFPRVKEINLHRDATWENRAALGVIFHGIGFSYKPESATPK